MEKVMQGQGKERILQAADTLFYKEGILSVGVDRIASESGVTKRTLYYHFPSKEDLVLAYLERRNQETVAAIAQTMENSGPLPGDRVLSIFKFFIAWFSSKEYAGCAFLNALETKSEFVLDPVRMHKKHVNVLIEQELQKVSNARAKDIAEEMMVLIDGAMARSSYAGSNTSKHAYRAAQMLLKAERIRFTN